MNLKFYFIKNEDLSHGSFHFCFLKANNTGYINILGVFKNKWFLACISRKKTLWLHSNFLSNLMFGRSYDFSQIAFLETNSVYILGKVEFSLIVWFDVSVLFGKRLTSGCHIQCKKSSATFETMEEMHGLIHSEIILPAAKLDWKREVRFDGASQADDRLVSKMRGQGVLKTP